MAVDLQHTGDTTTSLPSEFLPHEEEEEDDDDVLLLSRSQATNNNNNNNNGNDKDQDDLIAELTHHMDRFLQLQDDDKFDLSAIGGYHNSELSWDLIGSPQSTLWSNQGSSEGSSQEASPPPTPGGSSCNWNSSTCTSTLDERFNSKQYHPNHHHEIIQSFNPSINIGPSSHQSLIHEQIRAIELSRLKQEQVRVLEQKLDANGESEETNVGRRTGPPAPPRPAPMRAVFLGGSGSRGGTGVFLPRSTPPQSTKKQGKGCSTVLIPARVVHALQQHFDQMATAYGPKSAAAFPPLHDVLVINRDGMYSLQKRQSRKSSQANEMSLPQEWTY